MGGLMNDVTLVIEGGYPFTVGGVSEWTSNLVAGLPNVSFAVAVLRDENEPTRSPAYELPPNVTCVTEVETPGQLPEGRIYHALSTGAAGAFAARAAAERGSRFVLSEHGLRWLEVRLDQPQYGPNNVLPDRHVVDAQTREAYAQAHAVTAVCSWNARLQERAARRTVRVVENAVPEVPVRHREHGAPLVGFVGRVHPIKDVMTFLRACRVVADEIPSASFAVVGPLEHVHYARRCSQLAARLGLDVAFTGSTDPAPWYARLDVLVLTSRSEAQPLVALEAMAAGVPVVATDVGGCRELLAGVGLVTPTRSPRATATAVLRLLHDERLREHAVAAGRARIADRHDPARLLRTFHELYEAAAA
jgi:polysaccharide biosynthesis protein PelF